MKKVIVFLTAYGIASTFAQENSNDITTSLHERSYNLKEPSDLGHHYVD